MAAASDASASGGTEPGL